MQEFPPRHGHPGLAGPSSAWAPESYGAPLSREGSFAKPASDAGSYMAGSVNDGWLSGLGDLTCCAGPVNVRYDQGMAGGYQQLPHTYAYAGHGDPAAAHFERHAMGKDIAYTQRQKAFCATVLVLLVGAATYGVTELGRHYQSQHLQRQEAQAAAALGQGGAAAHSLTLAPGGAMATDPGEQVHAPAPGEVAAGPAPAPEAASDGLPEEPEVPAGAAAEAVPAAPVPGDAGLSTSTTLGKYDCSEQSEDRSTWSALKIVWCCQYEEVACDLADKAPGAAESVDMGSCAQYGCVEYDQGHDCQCNLGCLEHSNCCVDFAQSCASMQSWPEAPGADAARSVPLPEPMVDASAAALSQDTTSYTAPRSVESTTPPPPTVSVTSPAPSTTAVELLTTYGGSRTTSPGADALEATTSPLAADNASSAGDAVAATTTAPAPTPTAAPAPSEAAPSEAVSRKGKRGKALPADAEEVASTTDRGPASPPAGGDALDAAALPPILAQAPGGGPEGPGAPGGAAEGAEHEADASDCSAHCANNGQNSTCRSRLQFAAIYEFDGSKDACSSAYDLLVHDCPVCSNCVPKAAGCESALNNLTVTAA